jgi:3-hydroxyisobutyrate dehydrogenase-like beta-hydroxyacid dehydrogenase
MAERLARAGHELRVHDLRAQAMAEATARFGGEAVNSPAEAAAQSEAVVISVTGPDADSEVMLGAKGILAGARGGLIVADTTTVSVPMSRKHAQLCSEKNIEYLDAPISASQRGEGAGTLTIMVGGERRAFEQALSLLRCIGPRVHHVGPSGCGTAIKLINQSILVAYMAAFAEGLARGESMGIALDALLDVLDTSAAGSPTASTKYDEIRGRSNKRFPIDNAIGYLRLTNEGDSPCVTQTPVLDAALRSLQNAAQAGLGGEDVIVARHAYLDKKPRA